MVRLPSLRKSCPQGLLPTHPPPCAEAPAADAWVRCRWQRVPFVAATVASHSTPVSSHGGEVSSAGDAADHCREHKKGAVARTSEKDSVGLHGRLPPERQLLK